MEFCSVHTRAAQFYGTTSNDSQHALKMIYEVAKGRSMKSLNQQVHEQAALKGIELVKENYYFSMERKQETPKKRKLLVIGTGRCGTKYLSKLFVRNKIDVGHDLTGNEGVCSHWFSYDADWFPLLMTRPAGCAHLGEHKSDYEFENIYHLIRHPLTCIESIKNNFHEADCVFHNEMPNLQGVVRGDLFSAMRMYYEVNLVCEKQATFTICLENIDESAEEIAEIVFNKKLSVPRIKVVNASMRKTKPLKWKDLYKVNEELAQKIFEMACQYGYVNVGDE